LGKREAARKRRALMPDDRLLYESLRPSQDDTPGIDLDAIEAAVRIASSKRLGSRKRLGLLLFLEGVPVRRCAKLVVLGDHAALFRAADRYGLREIHRRRREIDTAEGHRDA
jgi:hypothetical protein